MRGRMFKLLDPQPLSPQEPANESGRARVERGG